MKLVLIMIIATYLGNFAMLIPINKINIFEFTSITILLGLLYIIIQRKNNSKEETLYAFAEYAFQAIFTISFAPVLTDSKYLSIAIISLILMFSVSLLKAYAYVYIFERDNKYKIA